MAPIHAQDLARDVLTACDQRVEAPLVVTGPRNSVIVYPAPGDALSTVQAIHRAGLTIHVHPAGTWRGVAVSR